MDPRDLVRSNGYLGPGLLSVGQVYMNLVPGTNWVSFEPSFVVTLDPQVNVGTARPDDAVELRGQLLKRRFRRKLMSELTNEFALLHDDLLRELAH
jgi:hypothetical protein